MSNPVTAVTAALTDRQRDTIVERFTTLNRHWRGAQCADILDVLADSDSDLDQTEPFFEANPDVADLDGAGVAARALIWAGEPLSAEAVRRVLGVRDDDPTGCPACGSGDYTVEEFDDRGEPDYGGPKRCEECGEAWV